MPDITSKSKAESLTSEIEQLERKLADQKAQLDRLIKNCTHNWSDTMYSPGNSHEADGTEYYRQYYGPSYPPSTYVIKVPPYWVRKCLNCGLVQKTEKTKLIYYDKDLQKQVPNFGGN